LDEIVDLVAEKCGIDKKTAKTAVETVMEYLDDKLPEPLAGQIDNVLEGGQVDDLLSGLGGLLGKK
jgi:hypothetical protein